MNLDRRTRELIAVGASVTANCLACIEFHAAQAREAGAGDGELREALNVGKLVRRGAANKFDEFAEAILTGSTPSDSPPSCCG